MSANGNTPKPIRAKGAVAGAFSQAAQELPPIALWVIPDGASLMIRVYVGAREFKIYMEREAVRDIGEYLIAESQR